MKQLFRMLSLCTVLSMCSLCLALLSTSSAFAAQERANAEIIKEKVLLDADMVDAFDDGVAMLLLAADPRIDLVGVTTVTGNSWATGGAASALYQLDVAQERDVPVFIGAQYPFRAQRHANIATERTMFGIGTDVWMGSFGLPMPMSWQAFYAETYGLHPTLKPAQEDAVDFIIKTIRQHPHEITLAVIGPCTNIALAIRKAPDIVPLVKKVIYMGGSFFKQGNVTPAAEFNWWFDPEAARMVLRAPFKEQIVVGLDVTEDIVFEKQHYDRFLATLQGNALGALLEKSHVGVSFGKDAHFTHFVWDVIVSAILIDPTLISKEVTAFVDVNDQFGLSYGQSLAFPINGPQGAQKMRIIMEIDKKRFWDMLNEKSYWEHIAQPPVQ